MKEFKFMNHLIKLLEEKGLGAGFIEKIKALNKKLVRHLSKGGNLDKFISWNRKAPLKGHLKDETNQLIDEGLAATNGLVGLLKSI